MCLQLTKCVEIGLPQLVLLVIFSQVRWDLTNHVTLREIKLHIFFLSFPFAVLATSDERGEERVWSICSIVLGYHSMDLCSSTHCRRSLQECAISNSIELQNWPRWHHKRCSLVIPSSNQKNEWTKKVMICDHMFAGLEFHILFNGELQPSMLENHLPWWLLHL